MNKQSDPDNYELKDEYDLAKMTVVAKGRYDPEKRLGKNLIILDPDVAEAFPSNEAVNAALRLVIQISRIPESHPTEPAYS